MNDIKSFTKVLEDNEALDNEPAVPGTMSYGEYVAKLGISALPVYGAKANEITYNEAVNMRQSDINANQAGLGGSGYMSAAKSAIRNDANVQRQENANEALTTQQNNYNSYLNYASGVQQQAQKAQEAVIAQAESDRKIQVDALTKTLVTGKYDGETAYNMAKQNGLSDAEANAIRITATSKYKPEASPTAKANETAVSSVTSKVEENNINLGNDYSSVKGIIQALRDNDYLGDDLYDQALAIAKKNGIEAISDADVVKYLGTPFNIGRFTDAKDENEAKSVITEITDDEDIQFLLALYWNTNKDNLAERIQAGLSTGTKDKPGL